MKTILVVLISTTILMLPIYASASTSSNIEQLAAQLDTTNQRIDSNARQISDDVADIESRISKITGQLTYTNEASKNINAKYDKLIEGLNSIENIRNNLKQVEVSQATYKEQLTAIRTDIVRIEKEINVSQTIVTWVTAIVSIIVVIVGLFFSQRFLDLYANYRVICSRLPKNEREDMGLGGK